MSGAPLRFKPQTTPQAWKHAGLVTEPFSITENDITFPLQKGIFIVDGKVFGTLKYVTGYTGFSGRADEQEGYYLALHYECEGADSIKVNGVTLDEDGLHILIIKKMGGKVKVEVSKDEDTYSEYIDISALKYE